MASFKEIAVYSLPIMWNHRGVKSGESLPGGRTAQKAFLFLPSTTRSTAMHVAPAARSAASHVPFEMAAPHKERVRRRSTARLQQG